MFLAFCVLLIVSDFDSLRSHWVFKVVYGLAPVMFVVAYGALQMRNKVDVVMKPLRKE